MVPRVCITLCVRNLVWNSGGKLLRKFMCDVMAYCSHSGYLLLLAKQLASSFRLTFRSQKMLASMYEICKMLHECTI